MACIKGFDYCGSRPCLNDGKCVLLKNCSFICICDTSSFYGELCQFTRDPNVFSTTQTLNLLVPINSLKKTFTKDVNMNFNFNQDLSPCLKRAWIESNPQFCMIF